MKINSKVDTLHHSIQPFLGSNISLRLQNQNFDPLHQNLMLCSCCLQAEIIVSQAKPMLFEVLRMISDQRRRTPKLSDDTSLVCASVRRIMLVKNVDA